MLGAVLLQLAALAAGSFVRGGLRFAPLRLLDSAGGLLLGGALGLAVVWVGASVALLTPGETTIRQEVERSEIVKQLDSALPPRTLLNLLARIDPLPSFLGPKAPSLPPSKGVLRDQSIRLATTRVVKILGTACGVGVEGSGWVAGPNLIVTAAHVVAGESGTTLVRIAGRPLPVLADVVVLDIRNDVAVLRVSGVDLEPLRFADPKPDASVAILGYPLDGGLTATPGRIGRTATVLTQDALGHGPVGRTITAVAGRVEHGDSGGPAVDANGRVESMIFAARLGSDSGYGVPPSIIRSDLAHAGTRPSPTTPARPRRAARGVARRRRAAGGTARRRRRRCASARAPSISSRPSASPTSRAPGPAARYRSCTCSGTTMPGTSLWTRTSVSVVRIGQTPTSTGIGQPPIRSRNASSASRSNRIWVMAKRAPAATLRWKRSASSPRSSAVGLTATPGKKVVGASIARPCQSSPALSLAISSTSPTESTSYTAWVPG